MLIDNYKNKTVIVTGGGTGIGYEIAKSFFAHGAHTNIVGRRKDILNKALKKMKKETSEIEGKIFAIQCDMSKENSVVNLFKNINNQFHSIDFLINNCGIWSSQLISELSNTEIEDHFNNTLKSTILSTKYAAKYMKKGSVIINIGSFAGILPMKNSSIYSSIKSAVNTFTKSSASELGLKGIRVNCVIPGVIRTPMTTKYIDENYDKIIEPISLREIGTCKDIANAVLFLCSDKASYITGAILEITGGKFVTQL